MRKLVLKIQKIWLEINGYEFIYSCKSEINGKKVLVFYFQKQTYVLPTEPFGSCLKVKNKKLVL